MKDNPFTSDIFTTTWLKHFNNSEEGISFDFLEKLLFVRHKIPNLYINCGKTHTKGISYVLNKWNTSDIRKKTILIYDVPTYFNLITHIENKNLRCDKIKQYPGYLIELQSFEDLNHYLQTNFSKSSRYKLKKYKKRLENCFDIQYKMYCGNISKDTYDQIFVHFKALLEKRFSEKQISNNNLDPAEWNFYHDVAYPMILGKKASLFVIYDGDKPIGVTLGYLSQDIFFDAITVFDVDYSKFHLGSINIMKLLEWCLEHKFKVFDFSKGHFDYKKRWANKSYDFEYHIYHDSNSILSKAVAIFLNNYFRIKQFLRDKKVNEKLHRLTFWLQNKSHNNTKEWKYSFSELNKEYRKEDLIAVDCDLPEQHFLKSMVFDFLYLNQVKRAHLRVYQVTNEHHTYLFKGLEHQAKVVLES